MPASHESFNRDCLFILKKIPSALHFQPGASANAIFSDGGKSSIGCLRCVNPRCLFFEEDEIKCDYISDFSSDKSKDVCPVSAISLNPSNLLPVVDAGKCIRCGICVSRCPVGALYFNDVGDILLSDCMMDIVRCEEYNEESLKEHLEQIVKLANVHHEGLFLESSDELFASIYRKLSRLGNESRNYLGRNLMIALGCKCAKSRTGDSYTRMDAVYYCPSESMGNFGAVEIEFGKDTLDTARNILDDIAVLNTRYNISKEDNKPLVICLNLPNGRQGYWQLLKDIDAVLNIKIETISIGALMMLLWNESVLELGKNHYYLNSDNMNLRQAICTQVGQDKLPVSSRKLGIFEPEKSKD